MRVLSEQHISQLLVHLERKECKNLLETLSSALSQFSAQNQPRYISQATIHQPLRSVITTKSNNTSLFMPVSNTASTGIKIVTASGLTGDINGVINVFTPEGRLTGLLGAVELTAFRTALVTMTLLWRCHKILKRHICIFGAGQQAEWHARLILLLFPDTVASVTFVNRSAARFRKLEGIRSGNPHVTINFLSKEGNANYDTELVSYLAQSDVIICCTPATEPLFRYESVSNPSAISRFFSLIGSYRPDMREVDTQTLLSGEDENIFVDSKEACLAEAGELIEAKVGADQLVEIGHLFTSGKEGLSQYPPSGYNIVFKCVGMGIMDLTVSNALLQMAIEKGLGLEVANL